MMRVDWTQNQHTRDAHILPNDFSGRFKLPTELQHARMSTTITGMLRTAPGKSLRM